MYDFREVSLIKREKIVLIYKIVLEEKSIDNLLIFEKENLLITEKRPSVYIDRRSFLGL